MNKYYTIFELNFDSALHLGQGRDVYDTLISELSSDRLSAAIAAMRAQVGKSDDLKEFLSSFTISTAFPYIRSGSSTEYYLPLPLGDKNISVEGMEEHLYRKQLKKLKYSELSIWQKYISGAPIVIQENQIHGAFLTPPVDVFEVPWVTEMKQRVFIDSGTGNNAVPFFFEWLYFHKNSGLYCIIDSDVSGDIISEVEYYLQLLGDAGVGSDKSVGGGHFTVTRTQIQISHTDNPDTMMSLSSYIPRMDEVKLLNLPDANYTLKIIGGYIAGAAQTEHRHLVKKSIYSFSTASCFPTIDNIKGQIVDLRPTWDAPLHPVYRSGKALFIPIKTKNRP